MVGISESNPSFLESNNINNNNIDSNNVTNNNIIQKNSNNYDRDNRSIRQEVTEDETTVGPNVANNASPEELALLAKLERANK